MSRSWSSPGTSNRVGGGAVRAGNRPRRRSLRAARRHLPDRSEGREEPGRAGGAAHDARGDRHGRRATGPSHTRGPWSVDALADLLGEKCRQQRGRRADPVAHVAPHSGRVLVLDTEKVPARGPARVAIGDQHPELRSSTSITTSTARPRFPQALAVEHAEFRRKLAADEPFAGGVTGGSSAAGPWTRRRSRAVPAKATTRSEMRLQRWPRNRSSPRRQCSPGSRTFSAGRSRTGSSTAFMAPRSTGQFPRRRQKSALEQNTRRPRRHREGHRTPAGEGQTHRRPLHLLEQRHRPPEHPAAQARRRRSHDPRLPPHHAPARGREAEGDEEWRELHLVHAGHVVRRARRPGPGTRARALALLDGARGVGARRREGHPARLPRLCRPRALHGAGGRLRPDPDRRRRPAVLHEGAVAPAGQGPRRRPGRPAPAVR